MLEWRWFSWFEGRRKEDRSIVIDFGIRSQKAMKTTPTLNCGKQCANEHGISGQRSAGLASRMKAGVDFGGD